MDSDRTVVKEISKEEVFVCHMPTFLREESIPALVRIASRRSGQVVTWRRDDGGIVTTFTTGDPAEVRKEFDMILPREFESEA